MNSVSPHKSRITFIVITATVVTIALFASILYLGSDMRSKTVDVEIPIISLAELLQLAQNRAAIIVDVREQKFYQYGHIPHATNIPDSTLTHMTAGQLLPLKKATVVVVYCGDSLCGVSFFAARKLIDLGINNVKVYANGVGEWQSCGLPMISTPR
jgi:rhodanese-related sulfurtransferase